MLHPSTKDMIENLAFFPSFVFSGTFPVFSYSPKLPSYMGRCHFPIYLYPNSYIFHITCFNQPVIHCYISTLNIKIITKTSSSYIPYSTICRITIYHQLLYTTSHCSPTEYTFTKNIFPKKAHLTE